MKSSIPVLVIATLTILGHITLSLASDTIRDSSYNSSKPDSLRMTSICQSASKASGGRQLGKAMFSVLDFQMDQHLAFMKTTLEIWEMCLKVNIAEKCISQDRKLREQKAIDADFRQAHSCIEAALKRLVKGRYAAKEELDCLLDFYALYEEVYQADMEPSGSLLSYSASYRDFSSRRTRLKSRLALYFD